VASSARALALLARSGIFEIEARQWVIERLFAFKVVFGPFIPAAALAAENATVTPDPQPDAMDDE
jgi:hypothetical protein